MHILNNLFEKIYVVTICLPNERINYIRDYFKKININFEIRISPHKNFLKEFTHIDKCVNCAEQSLTSNYASIFYESYYNGVENFVIIEDDNIFIENFENKFEQFYKNVPFNWDVIHLGDYDEESYINKKIINNFCDRIFLKYTTNCMIFKNPDKYKLIADLCINSRYPIDYVLNSLYMSEKLICYSPNIKMTNQLSYRDEKELQLFSNKRFSSLIRSI